MSCDPFWRNVSLLIVGETSTGPSSYNAIDESLAANTLTGPANSSAFVPSVGPFGNTCIDLSAYPVIYTPITSGGPLDCSTADFTLEGWFYLNSNTAVPWSIGTSPGSSLLVQFYGGDVYVDCEGNNIDTGATVNTGVWHHVALVQTGNYMTVYVDGVGVAPVNLGRGTWSGNLIIGGFYTSSTDFPGKISNVRLTKGVARYTANFTPPAADFPTCYQAPPPPSGTCDPDFSDVSLLLPFDSYPWQDYSNNGFPVSSSAVTIDTSAPRFGAGALAFSTGNSYLYAPVTTGGPLDLQYDTDWTVEFWFKTSSLAASGGLLWQVTGVGVDKFSCEYMETDGGTDGIIEVQYTGAVHANTANSAAAAIAVANTWYHVAAVMASNVLTVYVNGVGGTPEAIAPDTDLTPPGPYFVAGYLAGYSGSYVSVDHEIDELRVTKGLARYTSNFTPPTQAFGGQCLTPLPVPNVVGLSLAAAETAIEVNFTLGTVTTAASATVPAGYIISQNPTAGTAELPGTAVNIVNSLGNVVTVPNLYNVSQAIAVAELSALGLVAGTITPQHDVLIIAGNVDSQSVAAGSIVSVGTVVNLTVSSGRAPIAVPDLIGLTQAQAITALESIGLLPGAISFTESSTAPAGVVVSQSIGPGIPNPIYVASGTLVGFVVSSGVPPVEPSYDPSPTVISQYANSPTLLQWIENMSQYIDQTENFAEFLAYVWNVDTAVGFGLDIWGKIVNVSRLLHIPNDVSYVGFDIASESQPDQDWTPAGSNQPPGPPVGGAMYTGHNATEAYLLDDAAYRQLILAKAFANICSTTAPAINQILQNLYGAGAAYVLSAGVMAITYNFTFQPSAVQLAILEQSGIIPTPPGVSVSIVTP